MFDRLLATSNKPRFKSEKDLEPIECNFSGVKFRFVLPRHDDEFPPNESKRSFNVFDESEYIYDLGDAVEGLVPGSRVGVSRFGMPRVWQIYGEFWRSRPISEFGFSIKVFDFSKVIGELNCLVPEEFEQVINYENYYSAGPGCLVGRWISPVKWQIQRLGGADWVYFESWAQNFEEEGLRHFYTPKFDSTFNASFFLPLFRDKCIYVNFWSHSGRPDESCNSLKFRRIQAIANSFELVMPDALLQERAKFSAGRSYSAKRTPEYWDYPKREGESWDLSAPLTPPPLLVKPRKELGRMVAGFL